MSTQDKGKEVPPQGDDDIFTDLDHIHDSLLDELARDNRLESGVPHAQRGDDLDFIEMAGLASSQETGPEPDHELDFFEPGVKDVDASTLRDDLTMGQEPNETILEDTEDTPEDGDLAAELERLLSAEKETDPTPPDTAAAEQYLDDLQAQVSPAQAVSQPAMVPPDVEELPVHASWSAPPEEVPEDDLPETLPPSVPGESKHRRHKGRTRTHRLLFRAFLLIATACLLAIAGYVTYPHVLARITSPEERLSRAQALMARGAYVEAQREFSTFARSSPDHPGSAAAQFAAAYLMQMGEAGSASRQSASNERALALFAEFLREHPDHLKAPRAAVMTGILNYRLGNYQDAISILRDPELRLKDPVATLAVIRTLARSYAMLGEYSQAHSSYIQAAAHESNPAPDMDYNELGDLYQKMSAATSDPILRQAHREAAVEQWEYVMQTPGLSPSAKREVQAKIDAMAESLNLDVPSSAGSVEIMPAQDMPLLDTVRPDTIDIIEAEPVPEPATDDPSPWQEGESL